MFWIIISVWMNLSSDPFGLNSCFVSFSINASERMGLSRIDFEPFGSEYDSKRFFELVQKQILE